MKHQKQTRDGIRISHPTVSKSNIGQKHSQPVLLAVIHLLTVWFLASAWWQSLTSVFPIPADSLRVSVLLFFFAAAAVLLWNAPLHPGGKLLFLTVSCITAGFWIRRHMDAAAVVINSAANAYLAASAPDRDPYLVPTVSEPELILMCVLFLTPLVLLWSLCLRLHRGCVPAVILLLVPAASALIIGQVPSELSCWMVILSGGLFLAVFRFQNGRSALLCSVSAAGVLGLLVLVCAGGSRPIESYKQTPDGFYHRTRTIIQTTWIDPLEESVREIREDSPEDSQEADPAESESRNPDSETEDHTENDDIENIKIPDSANDPFDISDAASEADAEHTPETDAEQDTVNHVPEEPADSTDAQTSGEGETGTSGSMGNLNALSRFRPDNGTAFSVTLKEKPEATSYYPVAYGKVYQNSQWSEVPASEADDAAQGSASSDSGSLSAHSLMSIDDWNVAGEYTQYPDKLSRLIELCESHAPQTLDETTAFIRKEFTDHTVYDYEPGPTPDGTDFAEYFLFDNQKGFCVHFATTAALMYRICGYPARYVQGYAVPASAFHLQDDGTWIAEVTGEMGHAWCEVYDGNDWILEEHTLPYYGVRPETGIPATADGERPWIRNAAGWFLLILQILAKILVCLTAAAILFFLQAALRRQRKYRQFCVLHGGTGIRHVYRAIYDAAVFHSMPKTDLLSQSGFEQLRDHLPEMDTKSMEWLYRTVLETMFYEHVPTRVENRRAQKIYRQFSSLIKASLSPCQRFTYKYIKVL